MVIDMRQSASSSSLVCNLGALEPEQRRQHMNTIQEVFGAAKAIQGLPNGIALQFSNESPLVVRIADFIAAEQRCCPFLKFDLRVEPARRRATLSLTGGRGVKSFLKSEFADVLWSRTE